MEKSILEGLKKALKKNNELQGYGTFRSDGTMKSGYADLKPEFLIQCIIAFQIKDDFPLYVIKIEEPTRSFKDASVEINERLSLTSSFWKWNIGRKGFIDIGIYDEKNKPICPIEIKIVNPQKSRILKDLKRLVDFLESDNSSIKSGYFVYIYKEIIHYSSEQIPNDRKKAKSKIQELLEFSFKYDKEKYIIEPFCDTIGSYSNFESLDQTDEYESHDLAELINENIHYVGIIVKIKKICHANIESQT